MTPLDSVPPGHPLRLLDEGVLRLQQPLDGRAILGRFDALPHGLKDYIAHVFADPSMGDVYLKLILLKMLAHEVSDLMIDDVLTYCLLAGPHQKSLIRGRFDYSSDIPVQYFPIRTDVTSLWYYRLSGFEYDQTVPVRLQAEKTRSQIGALFTLHAFAHQFEKTVPVRVTVNNVIDPYDLAQYTVDHADRIDLITMIMHERSTSDVDIIDSVVNHMSPALCSGVL